MAGRKKPAQSKASRRKRGAGAKNVGRAGASHGKTDLGHLEEALGAIARFAKAVGRPSVVIGGIAVIAHGHARSTADIDVAVVADPGAANDVLRAAVACGLAPRIENALEFAQQNLVLLLKHPATGVEVDVSLAMQAFELAAAQHPVKIKIASVVLPITTLEALLVYKMVASRPRDLDDVRALLSRGERLDEKYVSGVLRDLDAVLDTDRASEFQRLLDDR